MQLMCMAMGRDTHAAPRNVGAMFLATLLAVGALQVEGARFPPPAKAQSWVGQARVVDGDTLQIGQEKFRLYGVDTPEKAQYCANATGQQYACGLVAKDALAQKIGTRDVQCSLKNKDQYGRNVAVCSAQPQLPGQQPEELNKWLVENGYAVAYREYSKDYIAYEDQAKAAKKGIWAGSFQYPATWRKEEKAGKSHSPVPPVPPLSSPALPPPPAPPSAQQVAASPRPAPTPAICGQGVQPIKGNIGSKGDKIYHTSQSPYYDRVTIEVEQGEKWFCTVAEAEAAGWRAPK